VDEGVGTGKFLQQKTKKSSHNQWIIENNVLHLHSNSKAQMAKLVDALCSGRSAFTGVQVRILFWAQKPGCTTAWFFVFIITK
jgi:hypothetical protein